MGVDQRQNIRAKLFSKLFSFHFWASSALYMVGSGNFSKLVSFAVAASRAVPFIPALLLLL